jgi:hypothetical protein
MGRPVSMVSFTLLAVGLTVLLSAYLYLRPSPQTFVTANRGVLAALPLYPGSRSIGETTSPVYDGDNALSRVVDYTTTQTFVLPRRLSSLTVVGWYLERLRSHCVVRHVFDGPVGEFTCGRSVVSVDAGGPLFTRQYEITIGSR